MGECLAGFYRHPEAAVRIAHIPVCIYRYHKCLRSDVIERKVVWVLCFAWRYSHGAERLGACCRYSDFMVNEIDASGQVVHLTNKSATQVKLQSLLISNPCRDAASLLQSDKAHTCSAPDRTKHRQIGSQQQASPMW